MIGNAMAIRKSLKPFVDRGTKQHPLRSARCRQLRRAGLRLSAEALEPRIALSASSLPGDLTIDLAAGNQQAPDVELGAGISLAVWSDSRAIVTGGYEGETSEDIYGVRISDDGTLIDSVPLPLVTSKASQTAPQASWNGTNWLVVYQSVDVSGTGFYYQPSLEAVRVAPDGHVLDDQPIRLYGLSPLGGSYWNVASDGNNWVVAHQGGAASNDVVAVRISAAGELLDPPNRTLVNATYYLRSNFQLAYANGVFMLTFADFDKALAVRFDQQLNVLSVDPNFMATPINSLASNGNEFFASFIKQLPNFSVIVAGTRITPDGAILDAGDINISGTAQSPQSGTIVVWDGLQWRVEWKANNVVRTARIAASGQLLDFGGVAVPGPTLGPATGTGNGGLQFVWSDFANNNYDVFTSFVSAANSPTPNRGLSVGAPRQLRPDVATDGNGYMVVYQSATASAVRVLAHPLDASGVPLTTEPIVLATGSVNTLRSAAIAWNGSTYMATWADSTGIVAKRIQPDGTVIDANPISVMPSAFGPVRIAALNGDFLVVGRKVGLNIQFINGVGARVRGSDGLVLDPAAVLLAPSYLRFGPQVTTVGGKWLVAWHRNFTHDESLATTDAVFMNSDGSLSPSFQVHGFFSTAGGNGVFELGLASNGDRAIAVQSQELTSGVETDLHARFIDADGTVSSMINLTPWSGNQYKPRVTWDGTHFVVVYQEQKNRQAPSTLDQLDARSDMYAIRIAPDGTVIDPQGMTLAAEPAGETDPTIVSQNGIWTFAYSRMLNDGQADNYRVMHEQLGETGNNTPVAVVSASSTEGDVPLLVNFDSSGSTDPDGTITNYAWDFGDGNTSDQANPSHSYTIPGAYLATLTVTDDGGLATRQQVLIQATAVNQLPVASAEADILSGPAPLNVIFDARGSYDPDGFIGNIEWRFDDGGMYYGSPAYNTFTTPGFHDVELRVYDSRGGVGVTHLLIHVQGNLAGDLDGDGQLGATDVNALSAVIANGSDHPAFDVNGDSLVNLDDLYYWVVNLKHTLMGDANLDSTVDGEDFIVWNGSKFTSSTAWTDGNFNADSFVDGSDFIVWNANKFQSALRLGAAHA